MPSTNPRIIVVDARQTLHHIVRAALELMGRRPRLIETYTSDDALTELNISSPDLMITAQVLDDMTDGPTLALAAKRELAALPILVIGEAADPLLDDEALDDAPFRYLRRPFGPELFLRELRVALDGPEAAPKEATSEEIIPVPLVDIDPLNKLMFDLMREVGAMAVVLADRNGKVVSFGGAAGYLDREAVAAALAPGFSATMKLLSVIGAQPRVLKQFDADRGNLFALALGLHYFLILYFEGNVPAAALGNVKRYGSAKVNEMLAQITPALAFDPRPVPPAPQSTMLPTPAKRRTKTHTQELNAVRAAQPAERAKTDKALKEDPPRTAAPHRDAVPPRKATPGVSSGPIANFDPSLLDALDTIDLSQANDIFDPDKLAQSVTSSDGERITFDDALMQGIIGNIDE